MFHKLFSLLAASVLLLGSFGADGASPVNLTLSARELAPSDPFGGYPDPYVIISYAFGISGRFEQIGKTSALADTQNPTWADVIRVDDFVPGTSQRLRFEMWDEDLDGDDLLGTVEFYLAELSNAENGRVEKELDIHGNGKLIVQNVAQPDSPAL
jgi:Ca2+-dependent lipid-binding protein